LIEKGLNIGFREHAAARGDGVHLFRAQGQLVHFADFEVQKRRHLVDEGARAARATAVHALFGTARDEDDLRVLAAEFHGRVRVGIIFADGGKRRLYFLYERNAAPLREPKPRRARDAHFDVAAEFFPHGGKARKHALLDFREVAFVTRI